MHTIHNIHQGHRIEGVVQAGNGRGRDLGAATANLDVSLAHDLVPGLYAANVQVLGTEYRGLVYYGINSITNRDCLEVHLLNFTHSDLYGKTIIVIIQKYLRPPRWFENIEELRLQIEQDIQDAQKQ